MADWFVLGFAIASIPLFIFGLNGNAMVIRIVYKTREMHTTTNYLLVNLAVSDAITIFTLAMYFPYDEVFGPSPKNFTKFSCKFAVIGDIATISSSSTLTVIAVERYHAILKPFSSNLRLNEENIKKAIGLIWTLSIVVGFPGFFLNVWNNDKTSCDGPFCSELNLARKIYLITFLLFTTYIPIVVFLFCYGSLVKGLYLSNEICAESTNEDNSEKKKLLITFILGTSGFILGYGPFTVFHTMKFFGKKIDPSLIEKLQMVGFFSFLISVCLNPVLYAFRSSSFKEGFKRIFHRCSSRTVEHNAN
ncbi:pyroglutamylated RF-amide peptide receptor-like [Acropora millepora]|uniref:pyroglutamylated RF-amide peptide receptor-like n=1 Tax=Acropora millepora TaxID=45264 RepID=UPI001CF0DCD2|nr:pyroglutamylated RF-amide peptide receptor-like [Acropora millepora]